jgi:hypothetical protein
MEALGTHNVITPATLVGICRPEMQTRPVLL